MKNAVAPRLSWWSLTGIVNLEAEHTTGRRVWDTSGMTALSAPCDKDFRFRHEIISPAVWLYHRFSHSCRDVEGMRAARGVTVTYETVRQRCPEFGRRYAKRLRRRRARPDDTWQPGKVLLKIEGKKHDLRRAVDQHGTVKGSGRVVI